MNIFIGMPEEELLELRDRVRSRIVNGAPVALSVAPGMRDELGGKSEGELRLMFIEISRALHLIDPERYPDPARYHPMGVVHYFV